jgi:hypothetical protein
VAAGVYSTLDVDDAEDGDISHAAGSLVGVGLLIVFAIHGG